MVTWTPHGGGAHLSALPSPLCLSSPLLSSPLTLRWPPPSSRAPLELARPAALACGGARAVLARGEGGAGARRGTSGTVHGCGVHGRAWAGPAAAARCSRARATARVRREQGARWWREQLAVQRRVSRAGAAAELEQEQSRRLARPARHARARSVSGVDLGGVQHASGSRAVAAAAGGCCSGAGAPPWVSTARTPRAEPHFTGEIRHR